MTRRIMIAGTDHDCGDQFVRDGMATTPGLPATAIPIGHSPEGLPIGVQVIGPLFEEHAPIRFAELMDQEFGGFVPRYSVERTGGTSR